MILHDYETSSGRKVIKEYIDSLTIPEMVDGYSVREKMENGEFEKLNIKRWEKKIYEVYFYKHNRIFYIIPDGDNIYLLHACRKQKKQNGKGRFKNNKKEQKNGERHWERNLYKNIEKEEWKICHSYKQI